MDVSKYRVTNGSDFKLSDYQTIPPQNSDEKEILKEQLQSDIEEIAKLQYLLFASDRFAFLMLFQAMDAGGKDGAIKHVMSGINPQGVQVFGFRKPSEMEYNHDFLWRHHQAIPPRGKMGIHNRSHYEFVLSCKVNPEFVLAEKLPGVHSLDDVNDEFWQLRYEQIRQFENLLIGTGLVINKFFLHVSKEEQRKRLLERIEDPHKNWKFELDDLNARSQWKLYQQAYEEAIQQTATKNAPWYIIPADDKWFARALIAKIVKKSLQKLDLKPPGLTPDAKVKLDLARIQLQSE